MRDEDKEALVWGGVTLWVGILFLFILSGLGLLWARAAGPFAEETRRKTFEQSQTYNRGTALDLDTLCRERRMATDAGVKATLADTIRLRSADYAGELPSHVQECVNEVR